MDAPETLARNLAAESRAYGYTLTIWGAGALLIANDGVPTFLQVFLYVGGALAGFALLAYAAFSGLLTTEEVEREASLTVVSLVHVVATFGNLLVTHLLIVLLDSRVPASATFLLVGLQATVGYNLLLLLEQALSRTLV